MVTEAGKELLRNTINTAKFHNKILEENEMWKQWELECGLTMMVSDDDIIKRIKKDHQCSKHRKRDKSRGRDSSRNKYEVAKIKQGAGSSNDRWDHSGFAELYPDAVVPDKYPSTSFSSLDRYKKKKKKNRRRSDSSDEEIWEEFKRHAQMWNKERTLRLIELLRDAPALWNINYPGYRNQYVKLKETKRIASVFHVDENEIITQIAFLVNEFHEEHKRLTLKKLKGPSASECPEIEWFAYKHLTFLIKNKNERYFNTIKNNPRKDENSRWVDSSDSYSDSEDETSLPSINRSSKCIKSEEQDEKINTHGKKADYSDMSLLSYSSSEDETFRPSANQSSRCIKTKIKEEKMEEHGKKANYTRSNLPYVQAYMAQKDSFSVYGEIVAHRMRGAKKSSKAIARAEKEIDFILSKFETGFFDPPEETFK